jgi:hypothetical protein
VLPALRSLARQLSTYAFTGPHAALVQCFCEHKATGTAMRQFYDDEWLRGGQERAREVARQWTWHYATPHGQAYHSDGLQCTTVASLIAVDPQVTPPSAPLNKWLILSNINTCAAGEARRGDGA